ncbi:3-hydroxyacyl-CoA dehydrogenase [Parvularcula sp. ZS-1/3]|uniref:3-hydroxyacyl-CoA dehydrogenase n=1 Tax=Parvularcula mediterranea TaxID=2732508 RepID=A0A7Y3RP95_9PROT|nr:3-hydroxyacyl-CoA dehydrogenase [Parvularcula mediterranea]NNU16872.1 3-hydroxyacyl-CoA dehydrogenase [Parvularcula mediterranea]
MELKGKTALITGGASGLGGATTRLFAEAGANVLILDRDADKGNALAEELGSHVAFTTADVTSEEEVSAAVDLAGERFGALHIACNFAGIAWAQKTVGKDGPHALDAFKKVIDINLVGSFNVIRFSALAMMRNDPDADHQRGVIVNTASVAAFEGQMGQAAYSASKGGIVGMTLPIARDLARDGIRCNTIAPGLIKTPLFEGLPEAAVQSLSEQPLFPKRLGDPAEIAHAAKFIVENNYVNGETIRCDGGIRMQPR